MVASVTEISFEHHREPFGIGEPEPRLSWVVETDEPDWIQRDAEIRVDGIVTEHAGRDSVLVPWPALPLRSRQQARVSVRVRGDHAYGPWSDEVTVEAGLLEPGDWTASFVAPAVPLLRGTFQVTGPVRQARLYVTAHGVFELTLNGSVVGDEVLAPGWTHYPKRLRYRAHDVTGLVRPGENVLSAMLADGWFRGRIGFGGGRREVYGDRLALLAQLEVSYADGTRETYGTGPGWECAPGPVVSAGIYEGETYDARQEDPDTWSPVTVLDVNLPLVAATGPPVRRTETLDPVAVLTTPSGRTVLDFGQNLTGRLRIRVRGEAGQTVKLRHAEVLEDGELATRPLRFAAATDRYTLRGDPGGEDWEPRFTFHGFRYAEVTGCAAEAEAVVCHTDLRRTGWFECSDADVNRLHENVVWSMRGNFLDVPTDCPQRDERLGWTGDLQIFAPTATFLYDCAGPLTSWLADLAAQQDPDGVPPLWVPGFDLPTFPHAPYAAWGDAAVIVPWVLYQRFGDLGILRAQYASMRAWVDGCAQRPPGRQLGDWLDPAAPPDRPAEASTDPQLVATAYLAHSAELVARTAKLLGDDSGYARYSGIAEGVVTPFWPNDTQTGYGLALRFGLLPDGEQRARAGARLAELVRERGYRIGTGFVGTPLICDALCDAGEHETAYRLLLERSCPSWLYPVTMGATTIWERWDSLLPDGTVNPGEMTSFNHYAFGSVADWLHRVVAGLSPDEPGYRRLLVAPRPGGGLTFASAAHVTPYGPARVGWSLEDETLTVTAVVPPNTTARVDLPGADAPRVGSVGSGSHEWRYPWS
ncbi:MAG: family 78 glycoside hydrolase catalytic domain [Streptosporangiaceae bacterium]|jgi:alpha-L-rhamnosidase